MWRELGERERELRARTPPRTPPEGGEDESESLLSS